MLINLNILKERLIKLSIALHESHDYISTLFHLLAEVVKLVNTRDLKSLDFGLAGSSPALGTKC